MDEKLRQRKALVVGGGPVGALTALSLYRRGWEVEIWDMREDSRGKNKPMINQRSINLNISNRGLEALRSVDPSLAEMMIYESIPMKGRMIHHMDGRLESQLYDPFDHQTGYSLSRPTLNQRLLEALPPEIKCRFNTKLGRIDFKKHKAWAVKVITETWPGEEEDEEVDGVLIAGDQKVKDLRAGVEEDRIGTEFDVILGCDGTWSKVRSEMMRSQRTDFSQSFISHAYVELHMPRDPSRSGGFKMDPNHLHIWPRHRFMLIGLPNRDGSFTLTLFAPFEDLEQIKTREDALHFFRTNYQTALDLAGEEQIIDGFLNNPRGNLVETRVLPTTLSSNAILLGDASHSMVPFYGQGLNCGLEDVRILNSYLERYHVSPTTHLPSGQPDPSLAAAFAAYSEERDKDLRAILDLAKHNYTEMRSHVLSPLHLLRRRIDHLLQTVIPSKPLRVSLTDPFPATKVTGWTSLYHMVTFRADIPYHAALQREQWQKDVISRVGMALGGIGILGLGWLGGIAWRAFSRR